MENDSDTSLTSSVESTYYFSSGDEDGPKGYLHEPECSGTENLPTSESEDDSQDRTSDMDVSW